MADDLSQVGRALALELLGITEPETEPSGATTGSAPATAPPESPTPDVAVWEPTGHGSGTSSAAPPPLRTAVAALDPPAPVSTTASQDEETAADTATPGRRRLQNGVEWLGVVVIAIAVALIVKLFVIQAFSIPSESMVSTLQVNDRVLVNKLSYDAHDIHRGDVVVFERPPGMTSAPNDPEDLIKRVIALPGETIEAHGGTVFINGRQLIEPYLAKGTRTDNLDQPVVVPKGKIFVMGDNRTRSRDSRFIGTIDEDLVVGRAFARIWPVSRIGFL